MKMLGVHQYENAVAAMLAAELFFEKYFAGKKNVPELKALQHAIREGIDRTQWMGRMELVSNDPFFLMDGAFPRFSGNHVTVFPAEMLRSPR